MRRRPGLALLLALAALAPACGRKGPPLPPRPVIPAAVGELRAEPQEAGILVTWTRPTRNQDGSPLTDLLEFRLSRSPGPEPEGRGNGFGFLAAVRAEAPDNAVLRDNRYAFLDDGGGRGLRPGVGYTYRVQAVNRRGVLGAPAEAAVAFGQAPPPPGRPSATAGDGVVELAWEAPAPDPRRPLVRGYNVYRAEEPGRRGRRPLNPDPITEPRYRDTGVQNERTYYYVVRSVGGERPPLRESPDSMEVSAAPTDRTPPAPPRGLVATPRPDGVALSWGPGGEPDLRGYLVYRRILPELVPRRLTPAPITATTFVDGEGRGPGRAAYTVTAVDRSPRGNESAPSDEVVVTLP
ncbi:MAG: fibronectin type III domain-containing protein [Candidatus Methylomirabilales bacterium]